MPLHDSFRYSVRICLFGFHIQESFRHWKFIFTDTRVDLMRFQCKAIDFKSLCLHLKSGKIAPGPFIFKGKCFFCYCNQTISQGAETKQSSTKIRLFFSIYVHFIDRNAFEANRTSKNSLPTAEMEWVEVLLANFIRTTFATYDGTSFVHFRSGVKRRTSETTVSMSRIKDIIDWWVCCRNNQRISIGKKRNSFDSYSGDDNHARGLPIRILDRNLNEVWRFSAKCTDIITWRRIIRFDVNWLLRSVLGIENIAIAQGWFISHCLNTTQYLWPNACW